MYKRMVIVFLVVVSSVGLFIFYSAEGSVSGQASVAEVNGSVITAQEFRKELKQQRASVIDYFHRSKGAEYGEGFWKADFNGENPEAMAKERALHEIVKLKIELELAKQHGLIEGITYGDLLHEMDRENKRRLAAVKAREPIYGPVQLDESTFINTYISKLRTQLKEKLSENELSVTDEDLKQHYELIKDTMFTTEDKIKFQKISVSYRVNERSESTSTPTKDMAQGLMESIKLLLDQGMELDDAVREGQAKNEALVIRYSEEEINDDTASTYFKSQAVLYSVLTDNLSVNQVSPVLDETMQGEYVLVKVTEKEASGYKSFDENKRNVWENYMNTRYDAYLNQLFQEARVDIHESNYNGIPVH
jgi:hypothetical protein